MATDTPGQMPGPVPASLVPQFEPIEPLRAHDHVAEQLRRPIDLHLIPPGGALPPERELSAMFGVGRATIQAAVRVLEAEGLVRTRRGRHGGTFVVAPGTDSTRDEYRLIRIRREQDRIHQALTFRELVECRVASESARVRTAEELTDIQHAAKEVARATSVLPFLARDSILHLLIAQSTHNAFLRDAVEQVRVVVNEAVILLSQDLAPWRDTSAEHEAVVDAIARQDGPNAERAMARHLQLTHQRIFELLDAG